MKTLILVYEIFITVMVASRDSESEEMKENIHKNVSVSAPFGAALFDLSSSVFLCNGAVYSPIFIFTSCRCLTSGIAITPHFIKRNASRYGVGIRPRSLSSEDARNDQEIGNGTYRVESFILDPLCFREKVPKPHRQHFGLIVLKDSGIEETVNPIVVNGRSADSKYTSTTLWMCRIIGLHTEDGQLRMIETEVVLMTSDDCMWRLCVPKIGCGGRDINILSGQELCLARADNEIPKHSFYEGSEVTCNGSDFGLIVSTGRIRYPQAPVILADIHQFLDQMPTDYDSQIPFNRSPKAPMTIRELIFFFLTLNVLPISNLS